MLILYKEVTDLQKVRSLLEIEGEICSLDPSVSRVRQQIYILQKDFFLDIWKEDCDCREGMIRAKLNLDGTPRKHKKYVLDWAL